MCVTLKGNGIGNAIVNGIGNGNGNGNGTVARVSLKKVNRVSNNNKDTQGSAFSFLATHIT